MKMKIIYSETQLECAVDFISQTNESFLGKDEEIRSTIIETMLELANDNDSTSIGTIGVRLFADKEFEDMDCDENVCRIEIYVDPSLHLINEAFEDDFQEQVIDI